MTRGNVRWSLTIGHRHAAMDLFVRGHSCAYVSRVLQAPYKRVWDFRNSIDIPEYDKAADPSLASLGRWGGLHTKILNRPNNQRVPVRKMTPNFHVARCRFPLWPDDGPPDGSYCGAYTKDGSSYCAQHHAICYIPRTEFRLAR